MNFVSTKILFAIVVLVASQEDIEDLGPCKRETLNLAKCLKPHQTYIHKNLSKVTGHEVLNATFIKTFVNFTNTLSTCIGLNNSCDDPRHYRYFLDSLTYIGKTLYEPNVHRCLENVSESIQACYALAPFKTMLRKPIKVEHFKNCIFKSMENIPICAQPSKNIYRAFEALHQLIMYYRDFKSGNMPVMVFNPNELKADDS